MNRLAACTAMVCLAVLLVGATGAEAAVEWSVVSSDEQAIRVRVEISDASVRPVADGSEWTAVRVPGASAVGDPGEPLLPVSARWVAIPLEGRPSLEIGDVDVEFLAAGRVEPSPTPFPVEEPLPGQPRLDERIVVGDRYTNHRADRGRVVTLGEPVHARRQRMVSVQVHPVLFDAPSSRIDVVRAVEFTIRHPRAPLSRRATPGAVDPLLRPGLLNPEIAREWRGLSPKLAALAEKGRVSVLPRSSSLERAYDPNALVAPPVRLAVGETGIVRVRGAQLLSEDRGNLPDTVRRDQLRLVKLRPRALDDPAYPRPQAIEVPLHFKDSPDPTGTLDRADEILFYGHGVEDEELLWIDDPANEPRATEGRPDHYNDDNVYFLLAQDPPTDGTWARMDVVPADAHADANPATSYARTQKFERDLGFQSDPESITYERYHWNKGYETGSASGSVRFVHPVPGTTVEMTFTAAARGGSAGPWNFELTPIGAEPGTGIDLGTFSPVPSPRGIRPYDRTLDDPSIAHGSWTFRMTRVGRETAPVSAYFGEIELSYQAQYRADQDALTFGLPSPDVDHDVEIPGFSTDTLLLFDVSDPTDPRALEIPAGGIVADGGTNTLRVRLRGADASARFVASSLFVLPTVTGFSVDSTPDLLATIDDVQVFVVGPEEFRNTSQRYIDHRRSRVGGRDWNFAYLDVQQIYDEFSGGLQSPSAIRDLAQWAYVQSDTKPLKALVLMGDAGEDAREITGEGSPNLVPAPLHVQVFGTAELLASDKWFGIFDYEGTSYPVGLGGSSNIVVGRLPARNANDLDRIISKIITYETPSDQDLWRTRTFWVADDAYSSDYFTNSDNPLCYKFQSNEPRFATSQQAAADDADGPLDGTLSAEFLNLDDYTSDFRSGDPDECQSAAQISQEYRNTYLDTFMSQLSQGWLTVAYQGHANYDVLGHENFMLVSYLNDDFPRVRNTDRPFVFFGMGCHVSDFCQPREALPFTRSIGEVLVTMDRGGAIATYGSSGYEFLVPNAYFTEVIARVMFRDGRANSAVFGDDLQSPWVLGEVLAQAEFATLAGRPSYSKMVAQYNLLGDPLLRLDAAPPRLATERRVSDDPPVFEDLASGATLTVAPGQTTVPLRVGAVDESGVDRIVVSDDVGFVYATIRPEATDADLRVLSRELDLPIRPQTYTVVVETFDGAYPELGRVQRTYAVELGTRIFADGAEITEFDELGLSTGRTIALEILVDSPVDLVEGDFALGFEGVEVSDLNATSEGDARSWSVTADIRAEADATLGALVLSVQGAPTTLLAPDGGGGPSGAAPAVFEHAPVPNPFRESTYISARVEGIVDRAELTVYDLTGRQVYRTERFEVYEVGPTGAEFSAVTVEWSARDDRGDEVANGTYLYRLTVSGPRGKARSDMGRVVVMR